MSWFGETFGDSLNSLKGQITKITKEVLADDEASSSTKQEPENELVKELEALCESKDLEIAALRDELNKLHSLYKSQVEFSKPHETKAYRSTCENHDLKIEELENQLVELQQERNHLNSCLEELQAEHQINLNEVILIRDKYKSELEILKKDYKSVKTELDEILSNSNAKEIYPDKSNEITQLNSRIEELQLLYKKEKEASVLAVQKEVENKNELKKQLEKLELDVQLISKDKEQVEEKRKTYEKENEELKNKLSETDKEKREIEIKLKALLCEKEELMEKCQKLEDERNENEIKLKGLTKNVNEVKKKLNNFLELSHMDPKEILNGDDFIEILTCIEAKFLEKDKELNKNLNQLSLEKELIRLKDENKDIQNKLTISIENGAEIERKYLEEISLLKNSLEEMKIQEQDCINKSQTDDLKRLEQEKSQFMSVICAKKNEISDYKKALNDSEEEIENLKAASLIVKKELLACQDERKALEDEIVFLKNLNSQLNQEKFELENRNARLMCASEKVEALQNELEKVVLSKSEIEMKLGELQNENSNLKNEYEHLKAEIIIKESSVIELMKANTFFQEEVNKLQAQCNQVFNLEKELKKWKDASVDLQIQKEDLLANKEELENECFKLKNELETGLNAKDVEIQQLKLTNSNLIKSNDELHQQFEIKAQEEQLSFTKECESEERNQENKELILQLQEENSELKSRIHKFQEQMKMQMLDSQPVSKDDVLQHRRSKSAIETEMLNLQKPQTNEDSGLLKQALQQEQAKYQVLQHQFQEVSTKEANARKEFERLRQHLIEVEDHYTEEAVENEKVINDLKSKLVAAEEQLQNSSTLYTSLKVRDNQHLESLSNQIRMVSAQRDDIQAKLSAAEDEVQKHQASLMSLQIVLEQFQQDKEREIEEVSMKYEKMLQVNNDHFKDLEMEIQGLKNQLAEAKNGLKAASRLGEQLEKKTVDMCQLEEKLKVVNEKLAELENNLAVANQSNVGKIDKSLIKNLVVGYILSPNGDRKSQVLRIMASVLDFDQEERNKMDVDASRSGWLSNILHPKGEGSANGQSLSEAFIRFLENESRPQPQLKFIPEQLEASASKTSRTSPKPSGRFSELMLPTFNSSQENESSIILKNVLKDS